MKTTLLVSSCFVFVHIEKEKITEMHSFAEISVTAGEQGSSAVAEGVSS